MSALREQKQRLREHAEHHLHLAAMEDLRRRHPAGTTRAYQGRGDLFWRRVFVPLYRRLPWGLKERGMRLAKMTADAGGWTAPAREPNEPWRPPPGAGGVQAPGRRL